MNKQNTQGKKGIKVTLLIAVVAIIAGIICGACAGKAGQDAKETAAAEAFLAENTSVEESIVEETVEEVATTEEVVEETVEEINPETFPVIEGKDSLLDSYMAIAEPSYIIQCTETDYLTGEQKYIEYLFNRVDRVFACIDEENLFYNHCKGKEAVAYVQNEDNTGFIKVTDYKEANGMMNAAISNTLTGWYEQDTDWIFTEGSDGVNGEYIYAYQRFQNEEGTESYKVSFFINKETNLPFMQVISTTMPATGEETVVKEAKFLYTYPDETSVDWDNFKTATTLPSEDEVVEVR